MTTSYTTTFPTETLAKTHFPPAHAARVNVSRVWRKVRRPTRKWTYRKLWTHMSHREARVTNFPLEYLEKHAYILPMNSSKYTNICTNSHEQLLEVSSAPTQSCPLISGWEVQDSSRCLTKECGKVKLFSSNRNSHSLSFPSEKL